MKCPKRFQTSSDPLDILIAEEEKEEQGGAGGEAGAEEGREASFFFFFCFLRIHENHLRELITVVTVSPPRLSRYLGSSEGFPLICCCWRRKKNSLAFGEKKEKKKSHLGWFADLQVLRLVGYAQLCGCLCHAEKKRLIGMFGMWSGAFAAQLKRVPAFVLNFFF